MDWCVLYHVDKDGGRVSISGLVIIVVDAGLGEFPKVMQKKALIRVGKEMLFVLFSLGVGQHFLEIR